MSKAPLLLRSSPGFGTGSYGAAPINPIAEETTGNKDGESDPYGRFPPGLEEVRNRRRKSQSTSRSGTLGRASTSSLRIRRPSEEIGGSTVVGGLEGRFGVTETAVLNDTLSDTKSESGASGPSDGESDDDSASEVINEDDPPDNSPYAQVRASVAPTDNYTLSISTPRMWILSTLFAVLGSSTNLFFSLRYPSVAITPVIALLLVHPLGLVWDLLLKRDDDPEEEFVDGVRVTVADAASPTHSNLPPLQQRGRAQRFRLWLAQGTWNEKEHSCVYVSSNVSFGFAFATDVIVEQTQFYKQDAPIVYQLLLTLSTQILGYAFAGLTRRFLVRPSGMIWPGTLMSAAMFGTLHKEENKPANGWRMSRWKFFYIIFFSSFIFYFIPGLLMPALSYFNVITWFAPDNVVVANLFGVVSGLGLFPLTFDWAQIAYIGSPLLTPFWAAMNVVGGLVIVMWIIAPIAYYTNLFYSSYMPILSASVFDNTGGVYDVSRILTSDFVFNKEAYSTYSRVFLPITYVLSYGLQFAGLASLLTHTACWHGKDIWTQWRRSLKEAEDEGKPSYQPLGTENNGLSPIARDDGERARLGMRRSNSNFDDLLSREDVHNRLMKRYKDAPISWYLMTAITMTAIGMFVVEYYPIHLPWYGLLLALGICSVLFIPIGIVMAVTNQHSSIYLICQLIAGAAFPGRPLANMVFVTYGYISSAQGIKFAADLKLGHYMKIPPRILFKVQMAATIISSLTQIGVLNWMFANVPGLCTPQAINGFTCPIARVHFNGSILWGVVGPAEFFGPGATYRPLVWCFLIGAIAPIPLWLYARGKRNSIVRKINLPVLFGSLSWIPPATGLNFSVWALVCYIFNYVIKNRAGAWWAKYTMTLSAALDSGLAVGIVTVFFGFIFPGWMEGFSWWGTEIYKQGCDWQACAYNTVANGTHFGPDKW
ncbi:OPT oligopeptide transporter protein-domain-containing protein [Truncatella angustata]|uniref:OPT oligopeptide transporter protein-domain-containing protein n=1 Tax=Truncatella angustata TaxID=152316 RepID=A0A9P8UX47_9PEZI|nr:OPT oligopeptide transporter protein-domain-containing protein [Truncatella angustata]KAH6659842.1 OPT oligopeptide transporter protein-domain-containing protein [Truncatella angustata]